MIEIQEEKLRNTQAEKHVLASCLQSEIALDECVEVLTVDHFYAKEHRILWEILQEVHSKGYSPDISLIGQDPRYSNRVGYLAEVFIQATSRGEGLKNLVNRLNNKKKLRDCRNAVLETVSALNNDDDYDHKSDKILEAISSIGKSVEKKVGLRHIKDIIPESMRHFEDVVSGKIKGIKTGITDFDNQTGGMYYGESIIISGRPGSGKTSVGLNVCEAMAEQGEKVAIISLEMQGKKLVNRFACMVGDGSIRNGHIRGKETATKKALQQYSDSMEKLSKLDIYIDDNVGQTVNSIVGSIRSFVKKTGAKVVMLDHFSLVKPDGESYSEKAYEKKDKIARGITELTKELDLIMIELVQLGRDSQNRRPHLGNLTDTKALEEGANFVLMIYNPVEGDTRRRVLCCEKARDGGMGDYSVHFHGDTAKILDMSREEKEQYMQDMQNGVDSTTRF